MLRLVHSAPGLTPAPPDNLKRFGFLQHYLLSSFKGPLMQPARIDEFEPALEDSINLAATALVHRKEPAVTRDSRGTNSGKGVRRTTGSTAAVVPIDDPANQRATQARLVPFLIEQAPVEVVENRTLPEEVHPLVLRFGEDVEPKLQVWQRLLAAELVQLQSDQAGRFANLKTKLRHFATPELKAKLAKAGGLIALRQLRENYGLLAGLMLALLLWSYGWWERMER
jgi:hypothetical protein